MKVFTAENTTINEEELKIAIRGTKANAAPGCCKWTIDD